MTPLRLIVAGHVPPPAPVKAKASGVTCHSAAQHAARALPGLAPADATGLMAVRAWLMAAAA
jgi:2-keto-3-deoxy-galactonokinase